MYVIRDILTAKPGMASKLAALMKDVMSAEPGPKVRITTDCIGPMNTVVMDFEVESLAHWEKMMTEYMSRTDLREKMKGYTDMYLTGSREIWRVM